MPEKDDFLYPRSNYQGEAKPESLVFNANLQEFAQKASYLQSRDQWQDGTARCLPKN